MLLGKGYRQPAELGEGLPVGATHGLVRSGDLAPGIEVVAVLDKARDAVPQHALFFGKLKIHDACLSNAGLQAEYGLGDDVFLDLVGAAVNGGGAAVHVAL